MIRLSESMNVWRFVFRQPKYLVLTFIVAIGFYILNALIANLSNIFVWSRTLGFYGTVRFIATLTFGFHHTITQLTLVTLVCIGLATGMLLSIIICKFQMSHQVRNNASFISSVGVFLAFLVPGCAACGVGLVALLGFGSTIANLPFQGSEISLLAIFFLFFAIFKVSNEFFKCKIIRKK